MPKSKSKSAIIVRDATFADATAINRLCVEAYEEFQSVIGPANWEQLRETLERTSELLSGGELIVAEDLSGLLGVVLYSPCGRAKHKNPAARCALLRTLAVTPSNRGRGIGRRLTQECIDRARKDGADSIALTTADMMTVARPMYERMGFIKDADLGERFGVKEARYLLKLNGTHASGVQT